MGVDRFPSLLLDPYARLHYVSHFVSHLCIGRSFHPSQTAIPHIQPLVVYPCSRPPPFITLTYITHRNERLPTPFPPQRVIITSRATSYRCVWTWETCCESSDREERSEQEDSCLRVAKDDPARAPLPRTPSPPPSAVAFPPLFFFSLFFLILPHTHLGPQPLRALTSSNLSGTRQSLMPFGWQSEPAQTERPWPGSKPCETTCTPCLATLRSSTLRNIPRYALPPTPHPTHLVFDCA